MCPKSYHLLGYYIFSKNYNLHLKSGKKLPNLVTLSSTHCCFQPDLKLHKIY